MVSMAMQVVAAEFVKGKKVLLRYDIDVALGQATGGRQQVTEDFKLRAGLPTLELCLENAAKVVIVGHLGRPFKTVDDEKQGNPFDLSAKPIQEWLEKTLGQEVAFAKNLEEAASSTDKIVLLENIRFFHGEIPGPEYHVSCVSKTCDIDFSHQLAGLGEVYVNEAFSAYNPAASTTMVPTLLPHAAGMHFAEEVKMLTGVRDNPKKPFVVIMGGAKVADKLPVINVLAEKADVVLVGGKLAAEIKEQNLTLPKNIMVGRLNEAGTDIAPETAESWCSLIKGAGMIVWNGPLGQIEGTVYSVQGTDEEKLGSARGTYEIAKMILNSQAQIVAGGGDTVAFLGSVGMLGEFEKKGLVSVGGGAMLKFLTEGTLPTIEVLS